MKKPKTYKELLDLINPKDLLEILNFSGINDKIDTLYWDIKRDLSSKVYKSMKDHKWHDWRNPLHMNLELTYDHYDVIVGCIQDFYWWSHRFCHTHAQAYRRVVNALEIPIEKLDEIFEGR